jgi:hypothetical protein
MTNPATAIVIAASPPPEIIHHRPEPDVTWGRGGIDDWGWTAEPPTEHSTTNYQLEPQP